MRGLLVVAMVLAFASAFGAVDLTVVDTGAPPNGSGTTLNVAQWQASQFSILQAGTITSVEGWIAATVAGAIQIRLYADGGHAPGTALNTTSFNAISSEGQWQGAAVSWAVTPGTYWLGYEVLPNSTYAGYMPRPAPHPLGNEASTVNGGAYQESNGLDIGVRVHESVANVPDRGSTAAMLFLTVSLLLTHKHLRVRNAAAMIF